MSITDRELLELAAKAAGIHPWIHCFGVPPYMGLRLPGGEIWNPLTDDGDALRLAVKLRLNVLASCTEMVKVARPNEIFASEQKAADEYAATRRAIVRAATEIGRAMP